ncbi:MAG TPA: ATPase domain-containing protein [Chloroflexia bacterium]|jgi:circadian clock protein KaiC
MTSPVSQPAGFERVPTGVPGFDVLLNGGFLRGGMYLISGQPGSGKTVFGNQMAFNHVANGGRAVYVTLLTETHARMLTHLSAFSFFRPEPIGDSLYYVSGYQMLQGGALTALLDLLQGVIRDQRATLLIMDGLAAVDESTGSDVLVKEFLQRLHVYAEAHGCTTLLLTHSDPGTRSRPEFTMVDGLVEMAARYFGSRTITEVEVSKLRGSKHLRGKHSYEITDEGVVVHPRTELVLRGLTAATGQNRKRLAFGIPGLDQMMHGGVLTGSNTVLYGVPGTGKTMLGLHFLQEGARNNEPGLYFGFYETAERLINNAEDLGFEFASYARKGDIEIVWQPPLEGNLDHLAEQLIAAVRRRGVKRLFLDGLSGFQEAGYPERLGRFTVALTNELRSLGVTTVFAVELLDVFGQALNLPSEGVSSSSENIILLRFVELHSQLYRIISIVKMRESSYDSSVREFMIDGSGIKVADTFRSAEAILTGVARPQGHGQAERDDEYARESTTDG